MKLSALFFAFAATAAIAGDHWPQFRGPNGDGHGDSKGLPTELGEDKNVKWKAPTHGKAWSSPVIWGSQVWLTTAAEDGKQLGVMCLDKETGKIVHDVKLFDVAEPQFCHKFNSYGSPTPVIEEGRIYVSFGSPGIACIDTKTAKKLWERRDFVCNHFRGAGSSPITWNNLLILPFDGSDKQYIAALDKQTGKTVWEVPRSIDFKDIQPDGKPEAEGDWRKGFATPQIVHVTLRPDIHVKPYDLLLSSGAKAHYGYDPADGKERFRFEERGAHSAASRPVVSSDGVWYITPGFGAKQVIALNIRDMRQMSEKSVVWREKKGAPNKPSVILDGEYLYMVDDTGIASCLDAKTGTMKWRERIGGDYSASPVIADGRIYFCSENGSVTVLATGPEFKKLGEGKFADGFMASPAISGKALYLRSKAALYRVEAAQ